MKSLSTFIKQHRKEIDDYIIQELGGPDQHRYKNDEERRGWILNDEPLYLWAKREGVKDI